MNNNTFDFIPVSSGPLVPVHKQVGQETDAQGNVLDIWFSDLIASTPAMAPFLKHYAQLIEDGFASPYVAWGEVNKLHIVYATNTEGKVVGGIAFEYRPIAKEGWLLLSFTENEFRGRRINGLLHQYFEEVIARRGGKQIASFVHVDNTSRLKSAERVNFVPQYHRMVKSVLK
jgi:hypothetical protein